MQTWRGLEMGEAVAQDDVEQEVLERVVRPQPADGLVHTLVDAGRRAKVSDRDICLVLLCCAFPVEGSGYALRLSERQARRRRESATRKIQAQMPAR